MASLFKPMIVRWVGPDGRRCKRTDPGAKKVNETSAKWYAKGVPGWPKEKKVPLATDRRVAQKMLADLVANAERGIADMPSADLSRASLADLLPGFEADMLLGLANKTRSAKKKPSTAQVALNCQRVRDLLAGCRFTVVADLNGAAPAKAAKYLAARLKLPRRDGGLSAQTAEFFRKALKRFAWWLSIRKQAPVRADLFDDVVGFDAKNNRVHARRMCPPEEMAWLLAATRAAAGDYRGLLGEDRYHLYLVAFASGFRAGELAVLTPASFALDHDPPLVVLSAQQTKNGKAARQPLPLGVASQLRSYLATKPAGEAVWPGTWAEKPAKMLKQDLRRAGISYRVETQEGPRYLDFHALRHSFVSALAAAGVGPKELQTLARHSDAQTTLNVYTHVDDSSLASAVGRLRLPAVDGEANPLAGMSRADLERCLIGMCALFSAVLMPTGTTKALPEPAAAEKPKPDRMSAA